MFGWIPRALRDFLDRFEDALLDWDLGDYCMCDDPDCEMCN